jgi:hypothetical protein
MDPKERSDRIAGWAGIVFSVLSLAVIPLALPPPPALGTGGAGFAEWFGTHRVGFLVGNYLGVGAFLPGFVQLAALAARVRRAEGEGGWLASLVLGTGTFAYAVFGCSLMVFQTLPFLTQPRLEAPMEAMGTFGAVWFALDGLAAFPFVVAVGWAASATRVLPRWFSNTTWVVASLALVMSLGGLTAEPAWLAGGGPATGLGFVGFFVWTLLLGVVFLRRG